MSDNSSLDQLSKELHDFQRAAEERMSRVETAVVRQETMLQLELKALASHAYVRDAIKPVEDSVGQMAREIGTLTTNITVLTKDIGTTNKRVEQIFEMAEENMVAKSQLDRQFHDFRVQIEKEKAEAEKQLILKQSDEIQRRLDEQLEREKERKPLNRIKSFSIYAVSITAIIGCCLLLLRLSFALAPALATAVQALLNVK